MRTERSGFLFVAMILSAVVHSCTRAPTTLAPQPDRVDVVPTTRVAKGDLAGVVVDADEFLWVSGARIVARAATPIGSADSTVTISDPHGSFTLRLPAAENLGRVKVTVEAEGWLPESLPDLSPSGPVGYAAVVTLKHRVPPLPPAPPNFRTIPPEPSDSVPPGTLRGTVIDDNSGFGIAGATVLLSDADPRAAPERRRPLATAFTDSLGRFLLRIVGVSDAAITVRLIGFRTVALRYAPQGERGSATTVALHPNLAVLCELRPSSSWAIYARVIDALTGKGPPAGATMLISTAGGQESMHGDRSIEDSLVKVHAGVHADGDSTTPTDVVIRAAGYRPWRMAHVRPTKNVCGGWGGVVLIAWLLPADPIVR